MRAHHDGTVRETHAALEYHSRHEAQRLPQLRPASPLLVPIRGVAGATRLLGRVITRVLWHAFAEAVALPHNPLHRNGERVGQLGAYDGAS